MEDVAVWEASRAVWRRLRQLFGTLVLANSFQRLARGFAPRTSRTKRGQSTNTCSRASWRRVGAGTLAQSVFTDRVLPLVRERCVLVLLPAHASTSAAAPGGGDRQGTAGFGNFDYMPVRISHRRSGASAQTMNLNLTRLLGRCSQKVIRSRPQTVFYFPVRFYDYAKGAHTLRRSMIRQQRARFSRFKRPRSRLLAAGYHTSGVLAVLQSHLCFWLDGFQDTYSRTGPEANADISPGQKHGDQSRRSIHYSWNRRTASGLRSVHGRTSTDLAAHPYNSRCRGRYQWET